MSSVTGLASMTPSQATQAIIACIVTLAYSGENNAGPLYYKLATQGSLTSSQTTELAGIIEYVWGLINPGTAIQSSDVTTISNNLDTSVQSL